MARRRFKKYRRSPRSFIRRGRRAKKKIPLLPVIGAVGGLMTSFSGGHSIFTSAQMVANGADPIGLGNTLVRETIGYDPMAHNWNIPSFTTLLVAGAIGSKLASKFGLNKAINLPYVKL